MNHDIPLFFLLHGLEHEEHLLPKPPQEPWIGVRPSNTPTVMAVNIIKKIAIERINVVI